ncbi:MAG: Ig-like domain-containing protein, partial [Gemmatimonadetes bacterium]|nr:Ig-like domain-containing protein [Gemmatimonadota bacterium]
MTAAGVRAPAPARVPARPARGRRATSALTLLAAGAALGACARTGFPEGGPVDDKPPSLVTTSPADRATDVSPESTIEIVFDEPLAPNAQAQASRLIFFNPSRPDVVTDVDGEKIEIQPRGPLEPSTTYSVTLLPGLPDRRNIAMKEPVRLLFSTGGPLTLTLLKGKVTA